MRLHCAGAMECRLHISIDVRSFNPNVGASFTDSFSAPHWMPFARSTLPITPRQLLRRTHSPTSARSNSKIRLCEGDPQNHGSSPSSNLSLPGVGSENSDTSHRVSDEPRCRTSTSYLDPSISSFQVSQVGREAHLGEWVEATGLSAWMKSLDSIFELSDSDHSVRDPPGSILLVRKTPTLQRTRENMGVSSEGPRSIRGYLPISGR